MIENNDDYFDDEIFGSTASGQPATNHRSAVRYVREDIIVFVILTNWLGLSKKKPVKLIDISSKGIAVESNQILAIKKQVSLELCIQNKQFLIPAIVIHRMGLNQYGLRFSQFNHELGDYLLLSQSELIFK